jgi:superfamily II DNA or RNA helicase
MQSVLTVCRRAFDQSSIARGTDYFHRGRVAFRGFSGVVATFSVKGNVDEPYRVMVDGTQLRSSLKLLLLCNCANYETGAFCKHIWASLIYIDRSSFASSFAVTSRVEVIHSNSFDEPGKNPNASAWKQLLSEIGEAQGPALKAQSEAGQSVEGSPSRRPEKAIYAIDVQHTLTSQQGLCLELWKISDEEDSKPKPLLETAKYLGAFTDPLDQEILRELLSNPFNLERDRGISRVWIPFVAAAGMLKPLCETGRLYLNSDGKVPALDQALSWDEEPWDLRLRLESKPRDTKKDQDYLLNGVLENGDDQKSCGDLLCVIKPDVLIFEDRIGRISRRDLFPWMASFKKLGKKSSGLPIPRSEGPELVEKLFSMGIIPDLKLPAELQFETETPIPEIKLRLSPSRGESRSFLLVSVSFRYGEHWIRDADSRSCIVEKDQRKIIMRHTEIESEAREWLSANGVSADGRCTMDGINPLIEGAIKKRWEVEAEGRKVRQAAQFKAKVSSGIDWFELSGTVQFENNSVELKNLLDAVEQGSNWVLLDDGSYGVLPAQWLKSLSLISSGGNRNGNAFRFSSAQGLLLDAFLSESSEVEADEKFKLFSDGLKKFKGLKPQKAPKAFKGDLRPYQTEGLAWLNFLADFGLGGILADDMGLGKTVQVLAFLQGRKKAGQVSMVVAPKSLIHNWMDESRRFTPNLRVLHYGGSVRGKSFLEAVANYDLVLVTYQTLRIDIEKFREVEFDCVIADEAQAIKNSTTLISRACRVVRARHRLAMTGTPVENRVDDLFSILEFCDPGLMAPAMKRKFQSTGASEDVKSLEMLARALRPVILRRTKDQVLKDLPEKSEQVLYCELPEDQMAMYAAARDRLRTGLDADIEKSGMAKSRILILTALLRLRQIACHPGLVEKNLVNEPSAKIDLLMEQLTEVIAEGHKALVFSQFTSLLSIVGKRLKKEGIKYDYLDGKTKDRKSVVDHFQNDSSTGSGSQIFLLSLKAGGIGLNLTAADYVFLLDPWWNPAVEAQAIDRVHRIGQLRRVMAYRLITKGTIEEKIVELQNSKRELVGALVQENRDFLRKMTREDLMELLS